MGDLEVCLPGMMFHGVCLWRDIRTAKISFLGSKLLRLRIVIQTVFSNVFGLGNYEAFHSLLFCSISMRMMLLLPSCLHGVNFIAVIDS